VTDSITNGLRGAGQRLSGLPKVFQGFKDFISRGNAIELAVGVVIGAAFGAVVVALNEGFISPVIGWIFGKPDLTELWDIGPYTWNDDIEATPIKVGVILNALLAFLLTAAAVYFLIVLPLNALAARRKRGEEEEPAAPAEDILLLQEIRDLLAARPTPAVLNDAGTGPTDTGTAATRPDAPPAAPPPAPRA